MNQRKPFVKFYIISIILFLIALVAFIVITLISVDEATSQDEGGRFLSPGSAEIELSDTGEWLVFFEYESDFLKDALGHTASLAEELRADAGAVGTRVGVMATGSEAGSLFLLQTYDDLSGIDAALSVYEKSNNSFHNFYLIPPSLQVHMTLKHSQ